MFNKLLPAIEDDVISASGSIPVVIEGIEHIYDTGASLPDMSYHNSHELLYLREGKIEASINGETITLDKGKILIIRPLTRHKLIIKSRKTQTCSTFILGFVHDTEDLCSAREGANHRRVRSVTMLRDRA